MLSPVADLQASSRGSTHRGPAPGWRNPWALRLTVALPLLLLAWRFDWLCDDAYITFVYARNLAEGHGLVYNPGQWVEGYSEFLWAIVLAAGQALGVTPLVLSRILSLAAAVALALWLADDLAERLPATPAARFGAALFAGSLPPLGVWATGGLATLPFTASVLLLFRLCWRRGGPAPAWKLGLVGSVCALLRADGAWWVAFTLGPAILLGLVQGEEPRRWRAPALGALFAASAFAAHMAWRLWAYGDWLPLTAHVKVGLSPYALARGGRYVLHFLATFPGLLLAGGVGLAALRRGAGPALILVGATLLYAIVVGGDFMAFGRFLVPMLPFLALALGAGLARVEKRRGPLMAGALALVCIALSLPPAFDRHPIPASWRTALSVRTNRGRLSKERSEFAQWRNMVMQAEEWRTLGQALARVGSPDEWLVYGAVGAIGWYSRMHVYDRNGLITPAVAHRPPVTDPPRSPGHDKTVPAEYFLDFDPPPDYLFVLWLPPGQGSWMERLRQTRNPQLLSYLEAGKLEPLPLPPGENPKPGFDLLIVPGPGRADGSRNQGRRSGIGG